MRLTYIAAIFIVQVLILGLPWKALEARANPENASSGKGGALSSSIPELLLRDAFLAQARGEHARAVSLCEAYLKQGARSAYTLSQYAISLAAIKRHDTSISSAREALRIQPGSAEVLMILSGVLHQAGKKKQALDILASALGKFESNPEIEFRLAEIYYSLKKYDSARLRYRQALFHASQAGSKASQIRKISLWRLSRIYLRARDHDNARLYLLRFAGLDTQNLLPHYILGHYLYFLKGDFLRAQHELELIAFEKPGSPRIRGVVLKNVYSDLGRIYFIFGDHRARIYLKKALRSKKPYYLDRALWHILDGKPKKALRIVIPYVKASPRNFVARYALLSALRVLGRKDLLLREIPTVSSLAGDINAHELGVELIREVLKLRKQEKVKNPPLSRLHLIMSRHYEALKQPHRSIYYLRSAIENGKIEGGFKNPKLRTALRLALARLMNSEKVGRHIESVALCDAIIKNDPANGKAYFIRASSFRSLGRLDKAIEDYTAALKIHKKNAYYYFFRAHTYHDAKQFEKAIADLKQALKLKKNFSAAANSLGYLYTEKGVNLKEAGIWIRRAIESSPMNGAYQDSLGWLYYRMKKWSKSRYHLRLAVLLLEDDHTEHPVVYFHLGDVYGELGQAKKALQTYRRALYFLERKIRNDKKGDKKISAKDKELKENIQKKIDRMQKTGQQI